jgi:hypothetical protein
MVLSQTRGSDCILWDERGAAAGDAYTGGWTNLNVLRIFLGGGCLAWVQMMIIMQHVLALGVVRVGVLLACGRGGGHISYYILLFISLPIYNALLLKYIPTSNMDGMLGVCPFSIRTSSFLYL